MAVVTAAPSQAAACLDLQATLWTKAKSEPIASMAAARYAWLEGSHGFVA